MKLNDSMPKTPRFHAQILIAALLVLALLAGALPQTARAAANLAPAYGNCDRTYVAKDGDTINSIARAYGLKWKDLAKANNMGRSDTIDVGTKLCIPSSKVSDSNLDESTFKFTAYASAGRVVISTSGFKYETAFFVRLSDANRASNWVKVGTLKVDKKAKQNTTYDLPGSLKTAKSINVCLKDVTTNALLCRTVVNK